MLLAMYQKKEMTVLLKEHGKYCIVKKPVLSLLEEACLFFGSTLQGRTIAAKKNFTDSPKGSHFSVREKGNPLVSDCFRYAG